MKRSRVEAFTDAVVAIIMTIMVLEIHVPEVSTLLGILDEVPYLLAFTLSFFFICSAWYHQHYLFSVTKWLSRQAFWMNTLWLFVMAFIPVTTAWVSRFPMAVVPEYSFLITYLLWAVTFHLLAYRLRADHRATYPKAAQLIADSPVFARGSLIFNSVLAIFGLATIWLWPPIGALCCTIQTLMYLIKTPKMGDRLYQ